MMQVDVDEDHFMFQAVEDENEIVLVDKGRHAYLWVGRSDDTGNIYTFSGPLALRALARAILKNVKP